MVGHSYFTWGGNAPEQGQRAICGTTRYRGKPDAKPLRGVRICGNCRRVKKARGWKRQITHECPKGHTFNVPKGQWPTCPFCEQGRSD